MKKWSFILGIFCSLSTIAQTGGYEISVTFKPFKNQYIYLGHYFGKQYPIIDSVKLDANSKAVFRGNKPLNGGIYLIGYPNKAGFFEILVDNKQQHFSVIADTATLKSGLSFVGSPDNALFNSYQQYMQTKGRAIAESRAQLALAKTAADTARINKEVGVLDSTIQSYREKLIRENPNSMLTTLLVAMREPELPVALKNPKTKQDSLDAYYFFRDHFWDGVNFWDGRLAYTTFFEQKVDKYINDLMVPNADSVRKELDRMLSFASINAEMTKMLLLKFVNRYYNQKYMWEDAVFVHLFEKYFAQRNYAWLTEAGRKMITDRAYSLMANIMGNSASNIVLPDSTGKMRELYADTATFTIVAFWDPTCGHCREVMPKIDSMYRAKWKSAGLKVYSVARETDGTKADWLKFIKDYNLYEWTNVYYSKAEEKRLIESSTPGYSQLYDVQTFPTLYLLDNNKRIIAKKLTWEQIEEVLKVKMKAG